MAYAFIHRLKKSSKLPVVAISPTTESALSGSIVDIDFVCTIVTPGRPDSYTYQWYLDNVAVSGATDYTYNPNTILEGPNDHTVFCRVTNRAGYVNTVVATISMVMPAITFTTDRAYDVVNEIGDGSYLFTGNINGYWELHILSSGVLSFADDTIVDVFGLGGGGCGGSSNDTSWKRGCGGGGSGYAMTSKDGSDVLHHNVDYYITIGDGAEYYDSVYNASVTPISGGTTSICDSSIFPADPSSYSGYCRYANGGVAGLSGRNGSSAQTNSGNGGDGGSGGGPGSGDGSTDSISNYPPRKGASNGGTANSSPSNSNKLMKGGIGQGTNSVRAFGEASGTLYGGGGSGGLGRKGSASWSVQEGGEGGGGYSGCHENNGSGARNGGDGEDGTGGGGGGGAGSYPGGKGGSGRMILRPHGVEVV